MAVQSIMKLSDIVLMNVSDCLITLSVTLNILMTAHFYQVPRTNLANTWNIAGQNVIRFSDLVLWLPMTAVWQFWWLWTLQYTVIQQPLKEPYICECLWLPANITIDLEYLNGLHFYQVPKTTLAISEMLLGRMSYIFRTWYSEWHWLLFDSLNDFELNFALQGNLTALK